MPRFFALVQGGWTYRENNYPDPRPRGSDRSTTPTLYHCFHELYVNIRNLVIIGHFVQGGWTRAAVRRLCMFNTHLRCLIIMNLVQGGWTRTAVRRLGDKYYPNCYSTWEIVIANLPGLITLDIRCIKLGKTEPSDRWFCSDWFLNNDIVKTEYSVQEIWDGNRLDIFWVAREFFSQLW